MVYVYIHVPACVTAHTRNTYAHIWHMHAMYGSMYTCAYMAHMCTMQSVWYVNVYMCVHKCGMYAVHAWRVCTCVHVLCVGICGVVHALCQCACDVFVSLYG